MNAADAALVDEAVTAARAAQAAWAATPAAERGRVLRRTADILRARNQELSEIETIDTGKPISETLVADATSGADCLEYFGGIAASIAGEHIDLGGSFAYTRREPLGVVGAIGAWNYPIQIACWKSAPALACGNAMVFKPSELTPADRAEARRSLQGGRASRRRVQRRSRGAATRAARSSNTPASTRYR